MGNVKRWSQQVAVVRRVKVYQSLGSRSPPPQLTLFHKRSADRQPIIVKVEVTRKTQTPGRVVTRPSQTHGSDATGHYRQQLRRATPAVFFATATAANLDCPPVTAVT